MTLPLVSGVEGPAGGEWDLSPRHPSQSGLMLARQMELTDANVLGNVHGGEVMKMVDTAAGSPRRSTAGGPW
jgi:acyl-CoA hydrolase